MQTLTRSPFWIIPRRKTYALQTEMGVQWTQKLEQMFTDVKLSDDDNPNFRQYLADLEVKSAAACLFLFTILGACIAQHHGSAKKIAISPAQ